MLKILKQKKKKAKTIDQSAHPNLCIGDVVQLSPNECRNKMLAGCFMTVTEPKSWGCYGYVQTTGENGEMGFQAYYRAKWEEFYLIGKAEWVVGSTFSVDNDVA